MSDDLPARVGADAEIRISDAERDRSVALLRHHCTEGRLTLDEFSDRVGLIFEARTAADLQSVFADLPVVASATGPSTVVGSNSQALTRRSRAVHWTVAFMSGSRQRGRWRIEGSTNAVAFMGGCHLDLREAEVVGHEAVINAFAMMGGVDVIVPEGIEVILEGVAFMGGRDSTVKAVPVIPGSPVIRVRAFAFMGGVHVRSRGPRVAKPRSCRRAVRSAGDHAAAGIEAVVSDVQRELPPITPQGAPDGTVTILFSDIEGFTSLCEQLGDRAANELLREHYRLVRAEFERSGGYEVKVHGDGFMVAFSSARRALQCAIAIQTAQSEWNEVRPEGPELRVRMGLHTGEAIRDADDFLGTTVNLAARIADAARGDEVLVSGLLKELCASSGEFAFDEGCELELKGLSQPQRVYRVVYR